MTILSALHDGPRTYEELESKYGKHVQYFLNSLIRKKLVVRIPRGKGHVYGLALPPPANEPLVTKPAHRRPELRKQPA